MFRSNIGSYKLLLEEIKLRNNWIWLRLGKMFLIYLLCVSASHP